MNDGIERLIRLNETHSRLFIESSDERLIYTARHPTRIAALKCMDGRLHLPLITGTPLGIIQPFRNLGGKFEFGWPHFADLIYEWAHDGFSQGRACVLLVTYHFARYNPCRGCRGFNHNVEEAIRFTRNLCKEFEELHPSKTSVCALQWGIDTDTDAIILHGDNGEILDLALWSPEANPEFIHATLHKMYPDMVEPMLSDLVPLIQGNLAHVARRKLENRPDEDCDHKEWVLGVGRGFDWLHTPNTALIVGPFSPNLDEPILTAAGIIHANIEAGRISKKKPAVLLASAPFRNQSEMRYMQKKARFLRGFALETILRAMPDFKSKLLSLAVTVDMSTRKFDMIERD